MHIRELFVRKVEKRVANEGVAKVWDRDALREEVTEYVLTDTIERNLEKFLGLFSESMRTRGTDQAIEAMAAWCSGFFGSGKSHFVKVLGHVLANNPLEDGSAETAADLLVDRIPPDSRYASSIQSLLHVISKDAYCFPVFLEIKSKQDLINPDSVAEIALSAFYEARGLSHDVRVARHELFMVRSGIYEAFKDAYRERFGTSWEEARKDYHYYQQRVAEVLAQCSDEYADPAAALAALQGAEEHIKITATTFADELLAFLDEEKPRHPQQKPHLIFIIDELQQFIGENNDRIEEVRTLVEQLAAKGKGRVWFVATGQEALDKVLDRAGLQLQGLGKLNARFGCHLMLGSEDVQTVVDERLLKKRPTGLSHLEALYDSRDGYLADLCSIRAERDVPKLSKQSFTTSYPFLPYQPFLAQEIFDSMRGTKLAGTPRSMLDVCHAILKRLADDPCDLQQGGVRLVSFDLVYDEIKNELYNNDFLGSHGVKTIDQADQAVPGCPVSPTRVLKALWLVQRLSWIPRTVETITRLLVEHLGDDLHTLERQTEETLKKLCETGYVGFDESDRQYRHLSAEEGDIEKDILDYAQKLGTGDVLRRCRTMMRDEVLTGAKLSNFAAPYGSTGQLFDFAVTIDGESVRGALRDLKQPEVDAQDMLLEFHGPLSSTKIATAQARNVQEGPKGRTVSWFVGDAPELPGRLRRLLALEWITSDPKHTSGRGESYSRAMREKEDERGKLRDAIARELEGLFKAGTILVSGEELALDGKAELRTTVRSTFARMIPNVFPRFQPADKQFDGAKDAQQLLTSSVAPHTVAVDLGVFDQDDQLITGHELIEPISDALHDREDRGEDLDGASIGAYFEAAPFGWSEDLVRTLMAAMFRGGLITVTGGARTHYDYTDQASHEFLTKPTRFRKAQFRRAKTGLSHKQLTEAVQHLKALGVGDVQHSANEIARRVRRLAQDLAQDADRGRSTAGYGVPIAHTYELKEQCCPPVLDTDDPTAVTTSFLARVTAWTQLHGFVSELKGFLGHKRDQRYRQYHRLAARARSDKRLLDESDQAACVDEALADMEQVERDCSIMERWGLYEETAKKLEAAYRAVYVDWYRRVGDEANAAYGEIERSPEYSALAPDVRDPIVGAVFSPPGPLGFNVAETFDDLELLLTAADKRGLEQLEALSKAVHEYCAGVIGRLRAAAAEEKGEEPVEKIATVTVSTTLRGRRVKSADELDAVLGEVRAKCTKILEDKGVIELQ